MLLMELPKVSPMLIELALFDNKYIAAVNDGRVVVVNPDVDVVNFTELALRRIPSSYARCDEEFSGRR